MQILSAEEESPGMEGFLGLRAGLSHLLVTSRPPLYTPLREAPDIHSTDEETEACSVCTQQNRGISLSPSASKARISHQQPVMFPVLHVCDLPI